MCSNYCLKDPRFSSKSKKVEQITRNKGFAAKWNFNFFLLQNTLIWRPFRLAHKSRVLLAEWLPVLRERNNSGNKGGNSMKQIESSVAMVTKPIQWEEFAAYDKLFSYFV